MFSKSSIKITNYFHEKKNMYSSELPTPKSQGSLGRRNSTNKGQEAGRKQARVARAWGRGMW